MCGLLILIGVAKKGFDGKWGTNWGDMTLRVNGNQVTGDYTHDQGKLKGTLSPDGRTITAKWSESPSYRAPNDGGMVKFTMAADGQSFQGIWGYGNNLNQKWWIAKRLSRCPENVE